MKDDERAKVLAEAIPELAQVQQLIKERDESLRQRGLDPEEQRERRKAALREDPEMQRRVEEAIAQFRRNGERSVAHDGSHAVAPRRSKAPRRMV